jgi:hypothetical protein
MDLELEKYLNNKVTDFMKITSVKATVLFLNHCVAQADCKLLGSSDSPASAS